ncbi:DUF5397 family protein [Zavarzinia sp. CC-PAN008]|uniref:DUF5397 family protein n=1 Tax=Zavarzinia sp. CC-PAN008 TaxID=3243332 RepID=UPI003F748389
MNMDIVPTPTRMVGTYRRFGLLGPVYQVVDVADELPDGDVLLHVRVLESGEELDYRYSRAIDDPREA